MRADHMKWEISGHRLKRLESDSKELRRAKALIERLRAENRALKTELSSREAEQREIVMRTLHGDQIARNLSRVFAIKLLAKRLRIL